MKKLKRYYLNHTEFEMQEHKHGEYFKVIDVETMLLDIREILGHCDDKWIKEGIKKIIQDYC